MANQKVFLVEDDMSFGAVLKSYLEINDYDVTWIADGADAIEAFKKDKFDVILLDVMLPNVDGFTIGKGIRQDDQATPLIYLTARSMKEDILNGYGIGADDYVTKPFDTEVLLAKVKAVTKREHVVPKQNKSEIYKIGSFKFNYRFRMLERGDDQVKLSPKEAALLRLLCKNENELLSRETALKEVWDNDDYFTSRSMDVYLTKLRKHLKADASIQIKNIHGSGFLLEVR